MFKVIRHRLPWSTDRSHVEEELVISPERGQHLNWSLSCLEVEDEKLGFVKNGWSTLNVKVTLLDKLGPD